MKKERIIVGGFIGLLAAGGITWDYIQYPVGLADLGYDVFYIEDTRLYPMYQKPGSQWDDCSASVDYLSRAMEYFGLSDRWAYRDEVSGKCFGMSAPRIAEILTTADIFINVSCASCLRDEYQKIPVRILIDTDPMFTQIQIISEQKFTPGEANLNQLVKAHNHLFTFGENIAQPDCQIPSNGYVWRPTRQPICLDYWNSAAVENKTLTTVMNWSAAKPLTYNNKSWGQKDVEFVKYIDLPRKIVNFNFAAAVAQTGGTGTSSPPIAQAKTFGWQILDPSAVAGDWLSYQKFIEDSAGEFSVAKQTYVDARTGWFSCRSACYLAAGRPVVTQETGWSKFIPSGSGLFAFSNQTEAVEACHTISADQIKHCREARRLAEEFFDSRRVLTELLDRI